MMGRKSDPFCKAIKINEEMGFFYLLWGFHLGCDALQTLTHHGHETSLGTLTETLHSRNVCFTSCY